MILKSCRSLRALPALWLFADRFANTSAGNRLALMLAPAFLQEEEHEILALPPLTRARSVRFIATPEVCESGSLTFDQSSDPAEEDGQEDGLEGNGKKNRKRDRKKKSGLRRNRALAEQEP